MEHVTSVENVVTGLSNTRLTLFFPDDIDENLVAPECLFRQELSGYGYILDEARCFWDIEKNLRADHRLGFRYHENIASALDSSSIEVSSRVKIFYGKRQNF